MFFLIFYGKSRKAVKYSLADMEKCTPSGYTDSLAKELDGIGEVGSEEIHEFFLGVVLLVELKRHEQRRRVRLVFVGQCDQHELVPRPDVQVVDSHRKLKQRIKLIL